MVMNETQQLQGVANELNDGVVRRLHKDVVRRLRRDVVCRFLDVNTQRELLQEKNLLWTEEDNIYQSDYMHPEALHVTTRDLVNGFHTEIAGPELNWVSEFMYGKKWPPGHIVFLEAGCYMGKNTYVEEMANNKRFGSMLILANRRANKTQILRRLGITDETIFPKATVMSYQSLEQDSDIWNEELEMFDTIVIDESHYFLKDAVFNARTNISLEKIMKTQNPVKIFMSATLWDLEEYLCQKIKQERRHNMIGDKVSGYLMKKNKQFINGIFCVDQKELIQQIRMSKDGWLLFVDSISKGENLQKLIGPEAVFISAETSVGGDKAAKAYNYLVETETLDHRVVITTSLLDNGVNIKDRKLKHVYIACDDRIEMIQMLGRKRCIDEEDSFKLYLPYQTKPELWKSFHLNKAEIELWKDTWAQLNAWGGYPPVLFSLDTEDGEKCRDIIYMNERDKSFCFNQLGFQNLRIVQKDLLDLCHADDPFLMKVHWLFDGIICPPILSDTSAVVDRKISRILQSVSTYLGETYPKKSDDFTNFRTTFSQMFWDEFSVDKDENHRADRPLQANKINDTCNKYGIPIQLIKRNLKIDGQRTTCYEIAKVEK